MAQLWVLKAVCRLLPGKSEVLGLFRTRPPFANPATVALLRPGLRKSLRPLEATFESGRN